MKGVAGLLLAAGSSSRMGRPKQLLSLGRASLLDHVLRQALSSDLDRVVLILGHKAEEIREGLKTPLDQPKLTVLRNPEYEKGISSSLLCGLREVEDEYEHVMVILGDMPLITSDLINLLLRRYLASGLPLGAVQTKRGRSHPVVLGRRFYPDLHRLRGDLGARELFARFPDELCLVESGEAYPDTDIDTPEDYEAIRRYHRRDPEGATGR
ncbi:MAG: nucleotidyltransferase family protein [Thermodesulfobacteriota bacterium]